LELPCILAFAVSCFTREWKFSLLFAFPDDLVGSKEDVMKKRIPMNKIRGECRKILSLLDKSNGRRSPAVDDSMEKLYGLLSLRYRQESTGVYGWGVRD
jgi:hypothetical protein